MTEVPDDLLYTKTHEWARIEGNRVTVGITDHAQTELTDIVYVELPEIGREVSAGDDLAVVESVKSTSDFISPVSGKVVEVHDDLENSPEKVNQEPYGEGWLVVIECQNPQDEKLLTPEQYKAELA